MSFFLFFSFLNGATYRTDAIIENSCHLEDDWQAAPPSEQSSADQSPPQLFPAAIKLRKGLSQSSKLAIFPKRVTLFYLWNLLSLYLPPGENCYRTGHTNRGVSNTELTKLDGVKEGNLGVAVDTSNSRSQEAEAR